MLDDIVDICTNTSSEAIRAMEAMVEKWGSSPDEHKRPHTDLQISEECRDGIAVFESLIFNTSDVAVDSFEGWCLRNVFHIPSDVPYVLPSQAGADFTATQDREEELLAEMDDLRKKIQQVCTILY